MLNSDNDESRDLCVLKKIKMKEQNCHPLFTPLCTSSSSVFSLVGLLGWTVFLGNCSVVGKVTRSYQWLS
jgi:hypothetical protein